MPTYLVFLSSFREYEQMILPKLLLHLRIEAPLQHAHEKNLHHSFDLQQQLKELRQPYKLLQQLAQQHTLLLIDF